MAKARPSSLSLLLCAVFLFSARVFAVSAVLGIDLGTEYIKAALVKPGIPLEIVLTKDSRRKETSAVAFKPPQNGPKPDSYPERAYGSDAMAIAARFPGDVYPNLKTVLGLPADHIDVQEYAARHPDLQLQADALRGTAAFKSKGAFTPDEEAWLVEELLAMELQSIRSNAEALAGDDSTVRSVVLTVPPFYTIEEKRAIELAAELAGLKVLSLISDGLAVGVNYATTRQFPNINEGGKAEYHMVFDMGAGSTKATVMKFQSRTVKDVGKFNKTIQEVQVLGNGWDRTLGGDLLNSLIVDDMVAQFVASSGAKAASVTLESVTASGRAMAKLAKEAERLRQVLSANNNAQTGIEGLYSDVDFKYKLSRADFEAKVEAYTARVTKAFEAALETAGITAKDLDSVVLHGGLTRTPFVQRELENALGSADKVRNNVNSDEAAVFGAGFRAAELSPSFRVKEIRIGDAAGYPVGMSWKSASNKAQSQRLWTATSSIGATPKEVTFTNREDFSVDFYQSVPLPASPETSVPRPIASFTTKNLTATVAEFKDKYSCESTDVQFKLAIRLSSEDGEVDVVKASVECEAEVMEKEGFVDGVKNLFGFGKKDQQPIKDGEESSSEDAAESLTVESETASTSTDASSTTSSSTTAEASGAAEETKEKFVKQKKLVVIPVDFEIQKSGAVQPSKAAVADLKDRLKAFEASDKSRRLREEALNQLEGFTYKVRDLLDNAEFLACATAEEKTTLETKNSEASDWLYGDGTDATKDELKKRLKELQGIVEPIQIRAAEGPQRAELVEDLRTALQQSKEFVDRIRDQYAELEAWSSRKAAGGPSTQSSSPSSASKSSSSATVEGSGSVTAEPSAFDFADLEDEDSESQRTTLRMEDVLEERGPLPPIYRLEDLAVLEELYNATLAWLDEKVAVQDKLDVTDDPVLRVQEIKERREAMSQAGINLAMKGVKDFESKKKKKDGSSKSSSTRKSKKSKSTASPSSTKTKKEKAKEPAATIELKPNADGSWPSDEEISEMLKQAGYADKPYRLEKEFRMATDKAKEAADAGRTDSDGDIPEDSNAGDANTGSKADGRKHQEL